MERDGGDAGEGGGGHGPGPTDLRSAEAPRHRLPVALGCGNHCGDH